MEQLQQQHHVEDVGRILLQTQDQLRQLREQLAAHGGGRHGATSPPHSAGSPAVSNNASAEIEEILERAEHELRAKAELVLRNLVGGGGQASPTRTRDGDFSLPSVRPPHSLPSPGGRRRRRERDASELDVDYFRQRFTPNTISTSEPGPSATSSGPVRRGGGLSVAHKPGKRVTAKTTTHARLLPYLHAYDPAAPRPVLSPVDAKQGVLSLLNRGFLPPNVDLTPAFQSTVAASPRAGGVIQNGAVKLYRRDEQPVRAVPYSNPSNFNLATLKFDMDATNVAMSHGGARDLSDGRDVARSPGHTALNTVTIRFAGERSPVHGNQEHEPDGAVAETTTGATAISEAPVAAAAVATTGADPLHELEADAAESDANSMDDLRRNVDKIRGYNELLDTYSLHQFIIHKGRALRETPEFQSFKRVAQEVWGAVEEVLRALEALLTRYFVPLAYVDGQRVLAVAAMALPSFAPHVLLACVVNEDQVTALVRRPGQRYKGKDRKKRAATTLQAFFRMLVARNTFRRVGRRGASAVRIQTAWRAWAAQRRLRRALAARRTEQLAAWQQQMARLRAQWPAVARARRVVVHVPSLSLDDHARLSLDHFAVQQNLQLARLAAAVDHDVEVVYVAPFELPGELAQYVVKLLQLCGVADAATRVHIVVPEHAMSGCFPAHWSLASLLLYSPHCQARIRRLVRGKDAYLVMGVPGDEDQRVALALQLPLLGVADLGAARPLLTRAGAKRLFIQADVNVPTGTYDLYDVDELLFALAKLIISHVDQNAWLLRLDAHDHVRATGTALLDVSALATLREIRREKKPPEYWKQPGIRDTVARALLHELERDIATLARPCHPERFRDWRAFAAAIARDGVVVEALPADVRGVVRANVFVAPSGETHVLSTQEAVRGAVGRAPLAFAFPQTLVPHDALAGAALAVARVLREDHAFCGYVSVDLLLGREHAAERLWAVALHPYLTDSAASFALFHALHGGALDAATGRYHVATPAPGAVASSPPPSLGTTAALVVHEAQLLRQALPTVTAPLEPRCYVAADFVVHPNLCTTPTAAFFHACRRHGVCFDVARRVGTVFQLPDSLTAGVFGVLSSGETPAQAAQFLRTALEVLGREVGTQSGGDGGNFAEALALLRHRAAAEKDREKQAARQPPPPPTGSGETTETPAPVARPESTPLLRVGKVDQMRRIRRTSQ